MRFEVDVGVGGSAGLWWLGWLFVGVVDCGCLWFTSYGLCLNSVGVAVDVVYIVDCWRYCLICLLLLRCYGCGFVVWMCWLLFGWVVLFRVSCLLLVADRFAFFWCCSGM